MSCLKIDLKDAYFMIPIYKESQSFSGSLLHGTLSTSSLAYHLACRVLSGSLLKAQSHTHRVRSKASAVYRRYTCLGEDREDQKGSHLWCVGDPGVHNKN